MVSSGDIKRAGDSSGVAEAIGFGDSCAVAIPMASHAAAIHDPQFAIRDSNIIAPVHVWKKIIAPFAVAQEFFIDAICDQLIVQPIESNKVICDALRCIFTRGPGFHQECKITGLRQQKFASELFEHTIRKRAGVLCVPARSFAHPLDRDLQMRINPSVACIEPHREMAVLAPS